MNEVNDVVIAGAGPTGLATALFLAERGHRVRILEKKTTPSPFSKAFGVNARTLDLLAPSGVTEAFLRNGRRLERLNVHRRGRVLSTLHLTEVDHPYPFMCVQSQMDSERLLTEAALAREVVIERGVEVTGLRQTSAFVEVDTTYSGGSRSLCTKVFFGADGASSTVRRLLGVDFEGISYPEPWKLYDIELETSLDPEEGHIFLLDRGGMFVVRHTGNIWRVLGSGPDLLGALPPGTRCGAVHWESEFAIANRVASRFSVSTIHLGGDAAHVHAGIGARGMNLGIEDAFVFATLYDQGRLEQYDTLRRPIVNKVVAQIARMMSVPRAQTVPGRVVRAFPFLVRILAPIARSRIQPWVLGLDHEIRLEL